MIPDEMIPEKFKDGFKKFLDKLYKNTGLKRVLLLIILVFICSAVTNIFVSYQQDKIIEKYKIELQSSQNKDFKLWLHKKEVFIEATDILIRNFDSSNFTGPGSERHIPTKDKPTTKEINAVLANLYLLSSDEKIPLKFMELLNEDCSPGDIGDFIKLVRKELGHSELNIDSGEIGFFYNTDLIEY